MWFMVIKTFSWSLFRSNGGKLADILATLEYLLRLCVCILQIWKYISKVISINVKLENNIRIGDGLSVLVFSTTWNIQIVSNGVFYQ